MIKNKTTKIVVVSGTEGQKPTGQPPESSLYSRESPPPMDRFTGLAARIWEFVKLKPGTLAPFSVEDVKKSDGSGDPDRASNIYLQLNLYEGISVTHQLLNESVATEFVVAPNGEIIHFNDDVDLKGIYGKKEVKSREFRIEYASPQPVDARSYMEQKANEIVDDLIMFGKPMGTERGL